MHTAYVTVYEWNWKPIGQVTVDISHICRNGKIDCAEINDVTVKAAMSLLKGKDIEHVHVFVHEGGPATPEELLKAAMEQHIRRGPDVVNRGRSRRIRRPGPIDPQTTREFKL